MILSLFAVLILSSVGYGAPQVKVGETTFIGRDVTGLKQDFFGGMSYH